MYVIIFLCLLWVLVLFFGKKLIVLLSLEGLMLSSIIFLASGFFTNFISFFLLILLSVFMVLDSVFGISLLISSSRCSAWSMKMMS